MIRSVATLVIGMTLSMAAHADQLASWSCQGSDIRLSSKTSYLGEDSKHTQTLYTLSRSVVGGGSEAYFLNVEEDIGPQGVLVLTGTNEVGGKFQYRGSHPRDESDGTTVRKTSQGTLTFSHGPIKGSESVSCVLE